MDLKELKEILQILDEKEIMEFELEEEGMKLRIRKAVPSSNHVSPPAALPPLVSLPASPATIPGPPPPPPAEPAAEDETPAAGVVVKSPIVGTFYRTPDPQTAPYVNLGDHVDVGQVLCIVEAMKLMNEIEAEIAGEIVRIHQETGQPVQ